MMDLPYNATINRRADSEGDIVNLHKERLFLLNPDREALQLHSTNRMRPGLRRCLGSFATGTYILLVLSGQLVLILLTNTYDFAPHPISDRIDSSLQQLHELHRHLISSAYGIVEQKAKSLSYPSYLSSATADGISIHVRVSFVALFGVSYDKAVKTASGKNTPLHCKVPIHSPEDTSMGSMPCNFNPRHVSHSTKHRKFALTNQVEFLGLDWELWYNLRSLRYTDGKRSTLRGAYSHNREGQAPHTSVVLVPFTISMPGENLFGPPNFCKRSTFVHKSLPASSSFPLLGSPLVQPLVRS
ncbi:hypothetical protein F4823DRAFT_467576 [Ustulina deusta]|nr:hypothetical protein F4823DRAFT_467576 [Ustulina deusta]